jgi:hypothetical protein
MRARRNNEEPTTFHPHLSPPGGSVVENENAPRRRTEGLPSARRSGCYRVVAITSLGRSQEAPSQGLSSQQLSSSPRAVSLSRPSKATSTLGGMVVAKVRYVQVVWRDARGRTLRRSAREDARRQDRAEAIECRRRYSIHENGGGSTRRAFEPTAETAIRVARVVG